MSDFYELIEKVDSAVAELPFNLLLTLLLASFAAVYVIALIACFASPKVKAANKKPLLCYVNLYTALVFIAVSSHLSALSAILPAAAFWIVGYVFYGLLCLVCNSRAKPAQEIGYAVTVPEPAVPKNYLRPEVPAAKTDVRLEHAIGITDRLLTRELGRSDRQELEKIKSTLAFLHGKGSLTVQESDILNDNFNALLKFMAKYNE